MSRAEWTNTPYHGEGRGATLFDLPYDTSGRSLFAIFPKKTDEEIEAELDANAPYPFMANFTKKVITTLKDAQYKAKAQQLALKKNDANFESMYWYLYCRVHDLYDLRRFYEERLDYYRGIRDTLPKRFKA